MMPILHWPGVMTPGQLGPTSRQFLPWRKRMARAVSRTGMRSVMATRTRIPASAASMMASAAAGGGTKIMVAVAPVLRTASATVLNRAKPSLVVPPLPGTTPPTICVPYSRHWVAWKVPALPRPWHRTRVFLSTRMLMGYDFTDKGAVKPTRCHGWAWRQRGGSFRRRHHLLGRVRQVRRRLDVQPALGQQLAALGHVGPLQPHHERHLRFDLLKGGNDRRRDGVALHDAAEDVD